VLYLSTDILLEAPEEYADCEDELEKCIFNQQHKSRKTVTPTCFSTPVPSSGVIMGHITFKKTRAVDEVSLQLCCSYKIQLKCYYNKIHF
jgi:hypothetical protein